MSRRSPILWIFVLLVLLLSACQSVGNGEVVAVATAISPTPIEPTVTPISSPSPSPTSTPKLETATTASTETPEPTATLEATATPGYEDGQIVEFEGEIRMWDEAEGEFVDLPEIGDTYFDKDLGQDMYYAGPETGYVGQYDYVVERIRNGNESVVCAPCYHGTLEADQSQGKDFLMQFLYGLSKWEANNDLLVTHGIDTSTQEAFVAGVRELGLPEGLVAPSYNGSDQYKMENIIPADINLDRVITGVYGPDQVDAIKYDKESPLKMSRNQIVLYNVGNAVQLGISTIEVDGETYLRRELILGLEEDSRTNLRANPNLAVNYVNWINKTFYHFTTLPESGQIYMDYYDSVNESRLPINFWGTTKLNLDSENIGKTMGADPNAVPILKLKSNT